MSPWAAPTEVTNRSPSTPHLTKSLRRASPGSPNRARHRGSRPANRPIFRPRAGLGWPTAIAGTADHCRKGLTPWKSPTRRDAARLGREEGSSRLGGLRHCWSLKHEYQSTRLLAEPVPVLQARPPSEHRVRIAMAAAHPMSCRQRQRPTRQPQPTEHFAGPATCAEHHVRVLPIQCSWIGVCRLPELAIKLTTAIHPNDVVALAPVGGHLVREAVHHGKSTSGVHS